MNRDWWRWVGLIGALGVASILTLTMSGRDRRVLPTTRRIGLTLGVVGMLIMNGARFIWSGPGASIPIGILSNVFLWSGISCVLWSYRSTFKNSPANRHVP